MITQIQKCYLFINIILFSYGSFQYKFILYFLSDNFIKNLFILNFIYLLRNYLFIYLTDRLTSVVPLICNDKSKWPVEKFKYEFHGYVITNTFLDSLSQVLFLNKIINISIQRSLFLDLLYFIPLTFMYEIIFDLFYYIVHRIGHNKLIYCYFHKLHHKFPHPITILFYYHHPVDYILSFCVPTITTLYFINNLSFYQFNIMLCFKNIVELFGHCGRRLYPVDCFAQCPSLAKYLNIELYSEDHDLHHSLNNCNYGKRFTLWDKVFNTYKNDKRILVKQ